MEMRGGCCIGMYGTGGAAGDGNVAWKMGRIMLRFRPIAPKPAVPAAGSAAEPAVAGQAGVGSGSSRRSKRKGGGSACASRGRKATKVEAEAKSSSLSSPTSSTSSATASTCSSIVTLPLMPETPERGEGRAAADTADRPNVVAPYESAPWLPLQSFSAIAATAEVVVPRPVRPAGSWVIVDCVTDTWREVEVGAAASDAAVVCALASDASCPGFITDELHRVAWTNMAYRRMVAGSPPAGEAAAAAAPEELEEVKVGLVTKGMVPAAGACRAFTCHVAVRYASRRNGKGTLAAPCDVWRLNDGRWAWRIDIKASLSLSNI